jgi:ferric-dicitrate binding protein FerR (iron transport regulator)
MHELDKSRLLSKLISEELDTAESERLESWLAQSDDNVAQKDQLQRVWDMSGNYEPSFEPNLEKGFAKFKQRTQQAEDLNNSPKVIRMRPGRLLVRIAAVFLLLIAATFLIKPGIFSSDQTLYASAESIETSDLSDGSQIWLNSNSSLKYAKNFGESSRDVFLSGEAFFNVARDTEKPFIINTKNTKITVLGTSFNVRETEDKNITSLDVKTGLVSFESLSSGEKVTVKAGESANFNLAKNSFDHDVSLTSNADSWLDGTFSFNGTPLGNVFEDLGKHFEVSFNFSNEAVRNCRYTSGEFKINNLEEIIEVLEGAFPITISKETDKNYMVQGSHCN